jgi:hypothetical protein
MHAWSMLFKEIQPFFKASIGKKLNIQLRKQLLFFTTHLYAA